MINKKIFDSLKTYKSHTDLNEIAKSFPQIFVNFLCLLSITIPPCMIFNIRYTADALFKFQMNFGNAIATGNFDLLDNVLLELLSSYYCGFPPYEFRIEFCESSRDRFIELCNSFKGKSWDEICDPFIDSVYELLSSCTVSGYPINLG